MTTTNRRAVIQSVAAVASTLALSPGIAGAAHTTIPAIVTDGAVSCLTTGIAGAPARDMRHTQRMTLRADHVAIELDPCGYEGGARIIESRHPAVVAFLREVEEARAASCYVNRPAD